MLTTTNGKYDGVSPPTVKMHLAGFAEQGRGEAKGLVATANQQNHKLSLSIDLWSKKKMALLEIVLHAIIRKKTQTAVATPQGMVTTAIRTWKMHECLGGAVPCATERHTGANIKQQADGALRLLGIENTTTGIFKKLRDCGSNIKKALENDDDVDCSDHTMETDVNASCQSWLR